MSEQQSENHLRPYVGLNGGRARLILCAYHPTNETHGHLFESIIGPFETADGARFFERWWRGSVKMSDQRGIIMEAEMLARHNPDHCKPEPSEAA